MPVKTRSKWYALAAVLVLWMVPVLVPSTAHAYQFYEDPDVNHACPDIDGLTKRIVVCIKETFVSTVNDVLYPFSAWLADTISAACLLAVVIWGYMVASGKVTAIWKDTLILGVKLGAVILFTTNFAQTAFDPNNTNGGLFGLMLDGINDLLGIVTNASGTFADDSCPVTFADASGTTALANPSLIIWDFVDCSVDDLIGGISSPGSLVGGLVGFFVSALFSGFIGAFIALLGFMIIIQLLFALARAMYIFLTSYMALSLMIIISPLFIPCILFESTKPYFEKWVKTTAGFILQPVFLFAYLAMLLWAFNAVVYANSSSLANVLSNDIACEFADADCTDNIGSALLSMGVYGDKQHGAHALNFDPAAVSAGLNSVGAGNVDTGVLGRLAQQVNNQTLNQNNWHSTSQSIFSLALEPANYFEMDTPLPGIDWTSLGCDNGYIDCFDGEPTPEDVAGYLVQVILSVIMAAVTAYIFLTLLDYLPFIGSGISGDVLNMPTFGAGNLTSPADKLYTKIRQVVPMMGGGGGGT